MSTARVVSYITTTDGPTLLSAAIEKLPLSMFLMWKLSHGDDIDRYGVNSVIKMKLIQAAHKFDFNSFDERFGQIIVSVLENRLQKKENPYMDDVRTILPYNSGSGFSRMDITRYSKLFMNAVKTSFERGTPIEQDAFLRIVMNDEGGTSGEASRVETIQRKYYKYWKIASECVKNELRYAEKAVETIGLISDRRLGLLDYDELESFWPDYNERLSIVEKQPAIAEAIYDIHVSKNPALFDEITSRAHDDWDNYINWLISKEEKDRPQKTYKLQDFFDEHSDQQQEFIDYVVEYLLFEDD